MTNMTPWPRIFDRGNNFKNGKWKWHKLRTICELFSSIYSSSLNGSFWVTISRHCTRGDWRERQKFCTIVNDFTLHQPWYTLAFWSKIRNAVTVTISTSHINRGQVIFWVKGPVHVLKFAVQRGEKFKGGSANFKTQHAEPLTFSPDRKYM